MQTSLYYNNRGIDRDKDGTPDYGRVPNKRAGFRKLNSDNSYTYFVYPTFFDKEIAAGLDAKHVKKLLKDKGILETDKDRGRLQKSVKVNGHKQMFIAINYEILKGERND